MKSFKPYANEADVLQIGGLQIENRVDRITVSGDIDLTADQKGLADARALHKVLADIVAHLESQQLPAQLPPPKSKKVDNPFA